MAGGAEGDYSVGGAGGGLTPSLAKGFASRLRVTGIAPPFPCWLRCGVVWRGFVAEGDKSARDGFGRMEREEFFGRLGVLGDLAIGLKKCRGG